MCSSSDEEFYSKYYSNEPLNRYKHKTYNETVSVLKDLIKFKKDKSRKSYIIDR